MIIIFISQFKECFVLQWRVLVSLIFAIFFCVLPWRQSTLFKITRIFVFFCPFKKIKFFFCSKITTNCSITSNLMYLVIFCPSLNIFFVCPRTDNLTKERDVDYLAISRLLSSQFFFCSLHFFYFLQPVLEDEPLLKNGNGIHINGNCSKYTNGHANGGHIYDNNNGTVNGNGLKSRKE